MCQFHWYVQSCLASSGVGRFFPEDDPYCGVSIARTKYGQGAVTLILQTDMRTDENDPLASNNVKKGKVI